MHLDADHPIPLTLFTAPSLHIAGKAGRAIAAHLGCGKAAKKITDRAEDPGICCRIGTGSAPYRALVDHHHLVELLSSKDALMDSRHLLCPVKLARQGAMENVIHQRRFTTARNTGDDREQTDGKSYRQSLQIVFCSLHHRKPAGTESRFDGWRLPHSRN